MSDASGSLSVPAGQIKIEIVLPQPSIGAVVDGASFSQAVAPCAIGSAFGENLTLQAQEIAGTVPLPTRLANSSLMIDGVEAPLFFVGSGQVNFQVPCEVTAGEHRAETEVSTMDGIKLRSQPVTVDISETAPSLFAWPDGQTAIVQDFGSDGKSFFVLDPDNPERFAAPGDFLVFYLSGLGQTIPATLSNTPVEAPLPELIQSAAITVGGMELPVLYGGLTPGFIGLYQINTQLPDDVAIGDAVPVVVSAG